MMNNKEEKLKKLLFDIINKLSKDADVYHHNGSLWLIHTVDRKWIVEYTKERTLWFNYNFFRSAFKFVSLDINDKNEYVTEWFESRFLNMNRVKHILDVSNPNPPGVEDTIENGVKNTKFTSTNFPLRVEHTIENGVKETLDAQGRSQISVENAIENGVKRTRFFSAPKRFRVEDTIENGVKDIIDPFWVDPVRIKDAIKNGVKETKENRLIRTISVISTIKNGVKHVEDGDWLDQDERIDDIIENGVKETKEISNISLTSEIFKVKAKQAIRDGVKEIQPLPAQDGKRDWGLYYHRQEDRTKPHTEYVKEVIEDSYNHRGRVEGIIRNTDKDGI
jgi:hypothetical protein